MTEARRSGSRWPRWIRMWLARPRLTSSLLVGLLVPLLLPAIAAIHAPSRVLIGWNAGALLYLGLAGQMMRTTSAEDMRRNALRQDDGRVAILVLVVLAAIAVVMAVGSQLATVKDMHGLLKSVHLGLAALTVLTSWLCTQTLLALHYAHDFYLHRMRHHSDPLLFPGTEDPGYLDFFYFACVIGTSGQTADVSFQGSALRRVGVLHCVLAFFFNATLIALAINIAAGLL
jgi:uncharacterized membrane protein